MNLPPFCVLLLAFLATACDSNDAATANPPAATPSATTAETGDELMSHFAEAWSRDDFSAMSQMLGDDVIYFDADSEAVGRDSVEAAFHGLMRGTNRMAISRIRSGASGDRAYHVGRWTVNPGESAEATGVHTFIFRRDPDGAWRISSAHVEDTDPPGGA